MDKIEVDGYWALGQWVVRVRGYASWVSGGVVAVVYRTFDAAEVQSKDPTEVAAQVLHSVSLQLAEVAERPTRRAGGPSPGGARHHI